MSMSNYVPSYFVDFLSVDDLFEVSSFFMLSDTSSARLWSRDIEPFFSASSLLLLANSAVELLALASVFSGETTLTHFS